MRWANSPHRDSPNDFMDRDMPIINDRIIPTDTGSLSDEVFNINQQVIINLLHFLKGQFLIEKALGGKRKIMWSEDDKKNWLVTLKGLRFVINLVSSIINNTTTITHLTPARIDYEYLLFKQKLVDELYRGYSIYFPSDLPIGEIMQRYEEIVSAVPNYIKFILHAVREGRVFNRLTTNVTENHVYSHEGNQKKGAWTLGGE